MTSPITGSGTLWCLWLQYQCRSWVDPFKLTGGQNCGELGTPGTSLGTEPVEIFPEVTIQPVPLGLRITV
jgi:hypothetical protein